MHKTFTLVSTSKTSTKNKQQAVMPVETPHISKSVIDSILNYSRSLTVKRSDSIGFIEVVAS